MEWADQWLHIPSHFPVCWTQLGQYEGEVDFSCSQLQSVTSPLEQKGSREQTGTIWVTVPFWGFSRGGTVPFPLLSKQFKHESSRAVPYLALLRWLIFQRQKHIPKCNILNYEHLSGQENERFILGLKKYYGKIMAPLHKGIRGLMQDQAVEEREDARNPFSSTDRKHS